MQTFDEWYSEIVERKFFEKYTIKDILKMAYMKTSESSETVSVLEEDEDLLLSEELSDPNFAKNHPELGLIDYEIPSPVETEGTKKS